MDLMAGISWKASGLVRLVQPGWVNSSLPGRPDFLNSFLLVPGSGPPVLSVAGTLEFEIFFYLVFTIFLWISPKHLARLLTGTFILLVIGFVSLDSRHTITYPNVAIKTGDASYTLYLSHILVISAFGKMYQAQGLDKLLSNLIFLLGTLGLCLLFALLAYRYIEQPILSYVRKERKSASS